MGGLSDPEACRQLLTVLDENDGDAFHKFIDGWQLPGEPSCIEIIDTITRFVHTGDYEQVETCTFADKPRPIGPSTSSGVGYHMPDGTVLWLTQAEWWSMFDQAVNNEAWRKANHDLLRRGRDHVLRRGDDSDDRPLRHRQEVHDLHAHLGSAGLTS